VSEYTPVDTTVIAAIATTCQIDRREVHPEIGVDELGLGSMGLIAVISQLEVAYDLEFTPEQVVPMLQTRSIREFIGLVEQAVGPDGPRPT